MQQTIPEERVLPLSETNLRSESTKWISAFVVSQPGSVFRSDDVLSDTKRETGYLRICYFESVARQ